MYGRAFLGTMAGGLLAAPRAAEAQPSGKVPRVGYLSVFSPSNPYPPSEAFWQGLHDLGWIEGQNIAIERRFAEGKATCRWSSPRSSSWSSTSRPPRPSG